MAAPKGNLRRLLGNRAQYELSRMILFSLVLETKKGDCYRCGEGIRSWRELSIEHKKPWFSSSAQKQTYFDLENIAFSHRGCNSRHGAKLLNKGRHVSIQFDNGTGVSFKGISEAVKHLGVEDESYYRKACLGRARLGHRVKNAILSYVPCAQK